MAEVRGLKEDIEEEVSNALPPCLGVVGKLYIQLGFAVKSLSSALPPVLRRE